MNPTLPRPGLPRVVWPVLAAMLVALGYVYFETAALATRWNWSACRLAPAIALFHGYPLYSPAETGPINGWLYGPVPALAWTPAVIAGSPLGALWIAAVISLIFMLGPLLFVAWRIGPKSPETAIVTGAAFVFGASALLGIYPTWYMVSALNGDFAAVGLGLTSCAVLLRGHQPPGWQRLALAASLTVLSAWSKQIEAPLVIAQALWLAGRDGLPAAGRFLIGCVIAGAVISAVILLSFGPAALFHNMWTIPSHHAFLGGRTAALGEVSDFFRYTGGFWLLCGFATFLTAARRTATGHRAWLAEQPWLLPALAALVLLPGAALATIKIGGDRNSIHSAYYLIAASTLAVSRVGRQLVHRAPRFTPALLLLGACIPLGLAVQLVSSYPQRAELPQRSLSPEAFEFSRQHPQEVYFPWDPLTTLLTDGRLYHFEYGIRDRIYAGQTPLPAQIAHGLPSRLRYVVYPRNGGPRVMLDRFFPGFRPLASPDGWLMYLKSEPAAPSPDPATLQK